MCVYLFLLLCYHSINQIITKYWDRYWCFDVWTFIGFDQGELISIWEMRVSYVVSWSNEWLHVRGIYYKRRCYLVRYSIDILCLDLNGLWCWSYWIKQVVSIEHGNLRPYITVLELLQRVARSISELALAYSTGSTDIRQWDQR